MKLRIAEHLWRPLCDEMLARHDVETAGLLLGEPIATPVGTVVAIREAFALPDHAYRIRRHDQLSLEPIALNRLMRPARDRGWSVFTVHTHPGAASPWFSAADDAGDARLMPSFRCQIPGVPHGSLVLVDGGAVVARAFDEFNLPTTIPVALVGRVLSENTSATDEEPWFHRQKLALGAYGQGRLRRLRVAVIGLGGIGSVVSMQLAHLGVGALILIDGDIVEASNVSRIAGAAKDDTGRARKVDVAARYARSVGLVQAVDALPEFLDVKHEALLAGCDVIVCCVDTQQPRALLNRLAYRRLVPVVDLGTVFRVNDSGQIVGDAGRVVVVGPGRPCLACWGHIDAHALRVESLSEEQREREIAAGYVQGSAEAQPSVVAFNVHVAGAGVVEVLRLATAFAGVDTPPLRLSFSFADGTVRRNTLVQSEACAICHVGGTSISGEEGLLSAANGQGRI